MLDLFINNFSTSELKSEGFATRPPESVSDSGVNFEDSGVNIKDSGVNFKDSGVNF